LKESAFERRCIEELRKIGGYWPDKADALSIRGLPDRVGCVMGVFVALEFKKSLAETRKRTGRIVLQEKTLQDIRANGGLAFMVCPENWEQVRTTIILEAGRLNE